MPQLQIATVSDNGGQNWPTAKQTFSLLLLVLKCVTFSVLTYTYLALKDPDEFVLEIMKTGRLPKNGQILRHSLPWYY